MAVIVVAPQPIGTSTGIFVTAAMTATGLGEATPIVATTVAIVTTDEMIVGTDMLTGTPTGTQTIPTVIIMVVDPVLGRSAVAVTATLVVLVDHLHTQEGLISGTQVLNLVLTVTTVVEQRATKPRIFKWGPDCEHHTL